MIEGFRFCLDRSHDPRGRGGAVVWGGGVGSHMPLATLGPRSEAWFVDEVVDLGDAVALRSPADPSFRWGNLLVLAEPLRPGERARWEARFAAAFAGLPEVRHRTFAWSGADGAVAELEAAGYEADRNAVRIAGPAELIAPERAPEGFALRQVRRESDWAAVLAMQLEDPHGEDPAAYRTHRERRAAVYRRIASGGVPGLRGAWYLATLDGEPAGSMGAFVRDGLARCQYVYVAERQRRRGVAGAMVHGVVRAAFETWGAARAVIMVDEGTQAERVYRRVGFETVIERYVGASLRGPGG